MLRKWEAKVKILRSWRLLWSVDKRKNKLEKLQEKSCWRTLTMGFCSLVQNVNLLSESKSLQFRINTALAWCGVMEMDLMGWVHGPLIIQWWEWIWWVRWCTPLSIRRAHQSFNDFSVVEKSLFAKGCRPERVRIPGRMSYIQECK